MILRSQGIVDKGARPEKSSDKGVDPGRDPTVDSLTILMIVIAGAIVGGMFIIIVFITCKLRGNVTEPIENKTDTDSDQEEKKHEILGLDPVTYSPSLAPVQDTSREGSFIGVPPETPVDMHIEPPPQLISSDRSELATSSELGYFTTRGTTLRELTDEFEKKFFA